MAPTRVDRAYDAQIDSVDKAKMSLVAKINTSDVDYYHTVIDASGVDLRNYNALGKPVLWEHAKDPRRHTDPIATAQWIRNNGGAKPTEILAKPVFLHDDFSRQRFEWYRDGVIKGWSVSILPDVNNSSPPTREELRGRPDWESAQLIYRKSTLAEFSGTVVPGNAKCLSDPERAMKVMDLVHRGLLWLPDEARAAYAASAAVAQPIILPELTPEERDRLANGDWSKPESQPKSLRSGPYIDTDGQTWTIRDASELAIVGFPTADMAERCLKAMGEDRSFDSIHTDSVFSDRAFGEQLKKDVLAVIELRLFGRV